jgi:hypothetical protein
MPSRIDWIPGQEEKLVEFMAVWRDKLSNAQMQSAYAWPAEECNAVKNAITAFTGARADYHAAPTAGNRTQKDEMKKAAVASMRKFARERVRNNANMNDGQKKELGVTVSDKEPSPVPVPSAGPEGEAIISAREPGAVKVRYIGAKPYGVDHVEIAWLVSDTAINSPDQLTNHDTFPHNPWSRIFSHDERAKKMYFSLRYLTREGKSNWSEVREVVIP